MSLFLKNTESLFPEKEFKVIDYAETEDSDSPSSDESEEEIVESDDEVEGEPVEEEEINDKDDKYLETAEVFDYNIANHILQNTDFFTPLLRKELIRNKNEDPFLTLKKYFNLATVEDGMGVIEVKYKQKKGKGRFNAVRSLSLQNLHREIRHSISSKYYVDVDMVNCHPVLLQFLCGKNNFRCDALTEYIQNRDTYIKDDPKAKTRFLIMTNQGEEKDSKGRTMEIAKTEFEKKYWTEMKKLHSAFAKKYPQDFKAQKQVRNDDGKPYNYEASFMNTLLCNLENDILMNMWKFYKKPKDAVLCFDGIMLRKQENSDYQLTKCEKYVEKHLGIKISLKIKEMNQGFDFSNRLVEVIDDEKEKRFRKALCKLRMNVESGELFDQEISEAFVQVIDGDIVVTGDFGGYKWNPKTKIWEEKSHAALMTEISSKDSMLFRTAQTLEQELVSSIKKETIDPKLGKQRLERVQKLKKCVHSVSDMRNIYTLAREQLLNEDFKVSVINRKHDLLPISGGLVVELMTGKVRNRIRDDYFSFECPVQLIEEREWGMTDILHLKKFIEQIFMEDEEYIKYMKVKLGSYLSGRITREIDFLHGHGRNGKSALINALEVILNKFCGFIGKDVIVYDPKQHKKKGGGTHTSHLIPIEGKRLVITQELEENDTLDGEMFKKIASGDTIEGVRECYGRKTTTIKPFCKAVGCTNKIPKFDVNETSLIDRTNICPFKARFLDKEGLKSEKEKGKYDETKHKYYEADQDLVEGYSKPGRDIDILFSWLVQGCVEFYTVIKTGIPKPKIVKQYIAEKIGENDVISQWVEERCMVTPLDDFIKLKGDDKRSHSTPPLVLYECFSLWAKENNCHNGYGKIKFYDSLSTTFNKRKTKDGWLYDRIRLKRYGDLIMEED